MINWKKCLNCAEKAGYKLTRDNLICFQRQKIKYTLPIEYDQCFYDEEIPQMEDILEVSKRGGKRGGIYGPTAVKIFNNYICSFFEEIKKMPVKSLSEERIVKIL